MSISQADVGMLLQFIPMSVKTLGKKLYESALTCLPPRQAIQLDFLLSQGRLPNLDHPKTFSEKIEARKLKDRDSRLPRLADKNKVKDYIAEKLGPAWVIPTLWSGPVLPPREQRRWPIPYVIKATHGSGQNYFVLSKEAENWPKIEAIASRWLKKKHGLPYREWLYSQIEPGVLVEPYQGDLAELPLDYKLFVFDGTVHYIQVDTGRKTNHLRAYYDRDWKCQEFAVGVPLEKNPVARPRSLSRMIEAAECIGKDFSFVRVDLYDLQDHPRFGELTFYPGSGRERFSPRDYDQIFGDLWKIRASTT